MGAEDNLIRDFQKETNTFLDAEKQLKQEEKSKWFWFGNVNKILQKIPTYDNIISNLNKKWYRNKNRIGVTDEENKKWKSNINNVSFF